MDLFKRLPKFRPISSEQQELIPLDQRHQHSALQKDFAILERELMPHFRLMDNQALIHQNWHRWMYMILIFGSTLVTILVIVQLATHVESLGIVGAVMAACLGIATLVSRIFPHHERYLNTRLAAELLRGEYFCFLGHFDPYTNEQDRVQKLIENVTDMVRKGESYNND